MTVEPQDIIYYNNKSLNVPMFSNKMDIILLDIRNKESFMNGNIMKSVYIII